MTWAQKHTCVAICQELLDLANENETFMKRIIKDDEYECMDSMWKQKCSVHNSLEKFSKPKNAHRKVICESLVNPFF